MVPPSASPIQEHRAQRSQSTAVLIELVMDSLYRRIRPSTSSVVFFRGLRGQSTSTTAGWSDRSDARMTPVVPTRDLLVLERRL
jgi:hypothetical protein